MKIRNKNILFSLICSFGLFCLIVPESAWAICSFGNCYNYNQPPYSTNNRMYNSKQQAFQNQMRRMQTSFTIQMLKRCKEGTWPDMSKCPPSPTPSPEEIELMRRCEEGTWPEPGNCPESPIPSPTSLPTSVSAPAVYTPPAIIEPSPSLTPEPAVISSPPSTKKVSLSPSKIEIREEKESFLNKVIFFIKSLFR